MINRGRRKLAGQHLVRQQQQCQTVRSARYRKPKPGTVSGGEAWPLRTQRSDEANNQRGVGRPINCTSTQRWWRHTGSSGGPQLRLKKSQQIA